jgi:hypothetical protein
MPGGSKVLMLAVGLTAPLLLLAILTLARSERASAAGPTCSTTLGVAVHGQHVVGDYVTGVGRENLAWPPSGGIVGEETGGDGVAIAGGPGPGFHFPNGFAPGASFCLLQSQSPGFHAGP